jgi:hypothetical protein
MNQALAGFQAGLQQGGKRPRMRNAVMTLLIPLVILVVGPIVVGILAGITGIAALAYLANVFQLVGLVLFYLPLFQMVNEVRSVTRETPFPVWFLLIPIYGLILWLTKVPAEVGKAKQMVGATQPVRGIVVYFFFVLYALAADVNDIAARMPPG